MDVSGFPLSHGQILILTPDEKVAAYAGEHIQRVLPESKVTQATSLDHFRTEMREHPFDLVVIDCDLADGKAIELIHEARLADNEPAILAVSATEDPRLVAEIFNMGVQRYIVKGDEWWQELGPAVRHSLRFRRLEEENRKLIGKLTEAHMTLEEQNRRLDEFNATVAHDIRGILGGLSMRLEHVLDIGDEVLTPKIRTLLTQAFKTSTHVTDIVQATYDFARLGSAAVKQDWVDLETLVTDVIADMAFDPALDIHVGIDTLPRVWGNANLLSRVFINLVSNAVKYHRTTPIIINIGVKEYLDNPSGKYVRIAVADNGRGIEEGALIKIFDMFWQDPNSRNEQKGLGIGLAVVRRIIELHRGTIRAESKVGEGTTFLFTLPVTSPSEEDTAE